MSANISLNIDSTSEDGVFRPKLEWKKPRIIFLNISKTNYGTMGNVTDGATSLLS